MAYIFYNPNPKHKRDGDCTIRAISKALDQDWDTTFIGIVIEAFEEKDMPSGNHVWGEYLKRHGFTRHMVEEYQTVEEFARSHPIGRYILCLNNHVVSVVDENWFDTFDSAHEIPIYYWKRNKEE